ncbi:MBL fold metallo-hydrolase [Synechocystis sp. B12]|nr:MBL fold metallo-hydrolase [Synechocystis sp. B12]
MKRRKFIRTAGAGLLAVAGVQIGDRLRPATAQASSGLQVEWLGHSAFLFSANGFRILANPFRAIGCTKGFRLPKVQADLVLISSQLWDEGAAENLPGNPRILFEPGSYDIGGIQFQGISAPHDRLGGRRFGQNVVWRWSQGGIRIVHMGEPLLPSPKNKNSFGQSRPSPNSRGGGPKNYDAAEAKAAMAILNPRMVVPTQYATPAADRGNCDLQTLQPFLDLVEGMNIQRINGNRLSSGPIISRQKGP